MNSFVATTPEQNRSPGSRVSEGPRSPLSSMRDAHYLSLLATEVVFMMFVVAFTLVVLRLLSLQTVTTIDGFSTDGAPSTKMMRNVGKNRRFHCAAMLSALTVALVCGHCYSAHGRWLSAVDCPSMSLPDIYKTNCERAIYFYLMDSPESSRNLLEGILENLGITRYVVNMGYHRGLQNKTHTKTRTR